MSKYDIVKNAFTYYDKNNEKNEYKFKDIKFIDFINKDSTDIKRKTINMYDKDKKLLFKYKYEIIGVYNNFTHTWTWAWSVPIFTKNSTYVSRKILQYGLDMEPTNTFLKAELITSRFRISDPVQLDLHIAIASYISKNPVIYKLIVYPKTQKSSKMLEITKHPLDEEYSTYYLFIIDEK